MNVSFPDSSMTIEDCLKAAKEKMPTHLDITLANVYKETAARKMAIATEYNRAIHLFESVSLTGFENRDFEYNIGRCMLQCVVCLLANGDVLQAQKTIKKYQMWDPSYSESSWDYKLAADMTTAYEKSDIKAFLTLTENGDVIIQDMWYITMFQRIRHKIMVKQAGDPV